MTEWMLTKVEMAITGLDLLKEIMDKPSTILTDGEAQVLLCEAIAQAQAKKLVEYIDKHGYWITTHAYGLEKPDWQQLKKEIGL